MQVMNPFALDAALELVGGPELVQRVGKSYHLIDDLLQKAYAAGAADTMAVAAKASDADEVITWKEGYDVGYTHGAEGVANSDYDEGYADGVHDARLHPAEADRNIADMLAPDIDEADLFDAVIAMDPRFVA
jgi:hypothetical protein